VISSVYLFIVDWLQISMFLVRMKMRERTSKSLVTLILLTNWH